MEIRHTSAAHSGQIFLPRVNTLLLIGVIILVLLFKNSSSLASAYGIAVTTAMVIDSLLAFIAIKYIWKYSTPVTLLIVTPLLLIESIFFGANVIIFFDGAWVPIVFAICLMMVMVTWRKGSRILSEKSKRLEIPLQSLISSLARKPPHKVPGTAVFLTSSPDHTPSALMHNLKHNKILHEKNVILTVKTADMPRIPESERVVIEPIDDLFSRVTITYGYMEFPNVPKALVICRKLGWKFDIMSTSFFLSRRSIKISANSGMPIWMDKLYIMLSKNASDATDFFQIPTGRVVEVGTQVTV
jgi:KUP system potassium uptake protein